MGNGVNIGIIRRSTGKWVVVRLNDAFDQIAVGHDHDSEGEARAEMEMHMRLKSQASRTNANAIAFPRFVPRQ